ncbi:hypothetical protein BGZ59_010569 [Podila verticillata]|nr:hypothetical protein BGZ59_010569 [Podila verticillata]
MLPNDTQEVDRLNDQHYIFKAVLGKNIHVPIPENGRVMDMGCGAGTWMMDMATELGTVHFVGADISNIYPTAIHPRNCSFYREDIVKGVMSQPNSSFDVVFQRNVAPGLTFQNWQAVIAEAYRLLKPGGSFESVETDVFVHQGGPQTNAIFEHLRISMATRKVDPTVVRDLRTLMIAAGFVDVNTKEYCIPLGDWGGQGGKLFRQNMQAIMQTVSAVLAKAGNVTEEYILQLVQGMMQETSRDRAYQIVYVTCGKKPLVDCPNVLNECLLMIIEYLYDDLNALRNLLLVNKFCFKAAVPLLYYNPI